MFGRYIQIVQRRGAPSLPGPQGIIASVGDDAQQPGFERASPVTTQCSVGFEEGVLGGVGGRVGIAHDPVGHVVGQTLVVQHQLVEGRQLAALGGGHECFFVHVPLH